MGGFVGPAGAFPEHVLHVIGPLLELAPPLPNRLEQLVYRAQAAALESHLDADGAAHEFRQLQIQLRIRDKHRQIEALKARVAGEPALNAELNARIKELHQLKGQRS